MDFNFDTGAIFGGLQSLDVSTLPPLGGQAGVLTVVGTGAITLPKGATVDQPASPISGMFRYNTAFNGLEYYDGTTWQQLSFASGAVSSFKLDDLSTTPIYTTSPTVSTTGAISASLTLSNQAANTVFSGPTTGANAQPTFRSLVTADIPAVSNLAGGVPGVIPYQSATDTTSFTTVGITGQILTSNGAGAPTWTTLSSEAVTSFSADTTGLSPATATTGAVTLGGVLNVAHGGTGDTALALNGVMFGNGTSAVGVTAAGVQYNVLTVGATGVPVFGTINLSQTGTAVSGILPLANGGTNSNLAGSNGSIVYNNGTSLVNSTVGTTNQALLSTGAGAPTWQTVSSTLTTNEILQGDTAGAFTANGGTFVGSPTYSGVTLQGTVTNATDAVTKAYVDAAISGLNVHDAVETTDTGTEITAAAGITYTAGVAGGSPDAGTGVGATLSGTGTIPVIGGYTLTATGQRVLIKMFSGADEYKNGIYVTTTLSGGWVLTRADDFDNHIYGQVEAGDFVFVSEGTQANTGWVETAVGTQSPGDCIKIGTDPIVFTQFSGAGTYSAGAGLALTGTVFSAKTDGTTTYVDGSNNIAVVSSATTEQVLLSQGTGNTASWGALPLGNSNAVTGILGAAHGGTGIDTSAAANGALLIGNGTGLSLSTLTAGAGIGIANGSGTITVSNTGVTSFTAGTTGFTPSTSTTGAVTLAGTLNVANGGTGATSFTANGVLYGNGASPAAATAAGVTGEILVGNTGAAPTWSTLTGVAVTSFKTDIAGLTPTLATTGDITLSGTIGIANGGTGQTTAVTAFNALAPTTTLGDLIYNNGTSNVRLPIGTAGQLLTVVTGEPTWVNAPATGVTSFSAGTTGFTPNTATTGAVTLAGSLNIVNGGTGLSSLGSANQIFGMNAAGTAAEYKTLTAGTGISVTNGVGVVTIANTGVTSVGLALPSIFTVSNSPVTTTGTLTGTLNTQVANAVFAGPSTGAAAVPTFRALTLDDLGTALQLYKESPSTPVTPVATGANAVAIGSGSSATAEGSFAEGDGASARIFGQKAYANGSFAASGDAQHGVYVLRNVTASASYVELYLDGTAATKKLILPNNSLFVFDILVAGVRTDGVNSQGAGYRFVGVAKKDGAGTLSFVGTPSKTILGETVTAWDARITADTVTDSIKIEARGAASTPANWVATVMTTEVTF
jgi:hypothetical protein